jgi:HPt (histidine-containing phosphotransfer) domain-containing protein
VIAAFLAESPDRLAALRAAVRSGDAPELAGAAHHLKGSAANVGATDLAALCASLETSNGSDDPGTAELVEQITAELDRAGRALAATVRRTE